MKNTIVVLLICVSLTQGLSLLKFPKNWEEAAQEALRSSEGHHEHPQRLLDEIEDVGVKHFAKKERYRNRVGKLWMKFKNKAKVNLENAREYIDEVEEELNSRPLVPEQAKKVIKDVRQQTRHIVKSIKKVIRPIKLSSKESDYEVRRPIEIPEIIESEVPEILPEHIKVLELPDVFPTELPEPTGNPEVLPTEHPEPTEDVDFFPTELPEPTKEPEKLSTDLPESKVLTEFRLPTEPETDVSQVEPVDEEHFIEEDDEKYANDEYGENEDESDDDDDDDDGDYDDGDDDEIKENSTEAPTEKERETERPKEVHEVVEMAHNMEEEKHLPKWLSKRQKKLTKLWQKYALRNSKNVLKKIKKLESFLSRKIEETK